MVGSTGTKDKCQSTSYVVSVTSMQSPFGDFVVIRLLRLSLSAVATVDKQFMMPSPTKPFVPFPARLQSFQIDLERF